ncbi:hypothetical protein [Microvirga sp. KLBC 81]|uniref:hypothetical protein n=1 Tax=Microvirga sp. KLBC 81 TaxID=1862707 RepID=UPI001404140A|nr:hypothetical protein [Microvirga sp. KLBC 81]
MKFQLLGANRKIPQLAADFGNRALTPSRQQAVFSPAAAGKMRPKPLPLAQSPIRHLPRWTPAVRGHRPFWLGHVLRE